MQVLRVSEENSAIPENTITSQVLPQTYSVSTLPDLVVRKLHMSLDSNMNQCHNKLPLSSGWQNCHRLVFVKLVDLFRFYP